MGITCQKCGTQNGEKDQFCSFCGNPLDEKKPAAPPSKKKGIHKTMVFGGAAADLGNPVEPKKTPPPKTAPYATLKSRDKKQIPIAKLSGGPAPATSKPLPHKPTGSRTMMGMAAISPEDARKASEKKAPSLPRGKGPSHKSTGGQTMLGIPALELSAPPRPPEPPKIAPAPMEDDASSVAAEAPETPQAAASSGNAPVTEPMPKVSEEEENAMNMATAPLSSPLADEADADFDDEEDDEAWSEETDEGRSGGLLIAVIAAGVVAVLVVAALLYLLFFDVTPTITPQIIPSADGKHLAVTLPFPEAAPGTIVEAVGQSVPVTDGTAKITLALSQMKLGLNDIVLTYTIPGDSPEQLTFPIMLRHTIRDDLSGLSADKPFFSVQFQVAGDTRLAVAGKAVSLTENSYSHRVSVDALDIVGQSGDVVMHKIPFQLIDATGAVEQGEHVVAVPLTPLQLDRPADDAQVVAESITCAGSVAADAKVTVNGAPVAVTGTTFNTMVPLDTMGAHSITIVAKSPGKAPRTRTVKVTRVESLAPAIEAWSADMDPKLDYPVIGRDPNAYLDKKVKLNGRVVNINTERGATAFILYVGQGCPPKSKCAVYVFFKGETDAGLLSWVDVYGTVRGTERVEMQNGVKIEVPAITAVYVVKADAKSNRKKR